MSIYLERVTKNYRSGWTLGPLDLAEQTINLEKIRHIQRIRAAFARLGDFGEYPRT